MIMNWGMTLEMPNVKKRLLKWIAKARGLYDVENNTWLGVSKYTWEIEGNDIFFFKGEDILEPDDIIALLTDKEELILELEFKLGWENIKMRAEYEQMLRRLEVLENE